MVRKRFREKNLWFISGLALLICFLSTAKVIAAPDPALLDRASQVQEEVLKDLETLVNIDSPADHAPGLEKIKDILSDKLKKLGADIEIFPAPKAGYNIVATFKGTGKGKILLLAHADTVFKTGTAAERPFKISDGKAYGPGVIDDKGSILTGLYALKILKERGFRDYARITFLINCDEEVGSPSSRGLIMKLAQGHDYAICLEGGKEGDGLVNWRKGTARVTVEVKGRASHAGSAPEKGANALVELAHQVLQLRTLENKEKGTTINFTVFHSGDKTNVIPDSAIARADMRTHYPEEIERVKQSGLEMIKNKLVPDTQVKFSLTAGRPAFPKNDKTEALIARARGIYGEIGLHLNVGGGGGGTDGNYTALVGTATIDSMGFVGGQGHTADEYMNIDSIPPRLYLLTRMLMELGSQK